MDLDDRRLALAATQEISQKLTHGLNDVTADYVLLSRADAVLAVGLIDGLAELLAKPTIRPSAG